MPDEDLTISVNLLDLGENTLFVEPTEAPPFRLEDLADFAPDA